MVIKGLASITPSLTNERLAVHTESIPKGYTVLVRRRSHSLMQSALSPDTNLGGMKCMASDMHKYNCHLFASGLESTTTVIHIIMIGII